MKKLLRILLKLLIGIVVLVAVLLAVAQIVLSNRVAGRIVSKVAAEYYDGDLSYSNIGASVIRRFPKLTINLSDVALTYPHDRFPEYDTTKVRYFLLNAGRSEEADTLASLGGLTADVNLFKFLFGVIRVDRVTIDAPAVYARVFADGDANWKLFRINGKEKEDSDTSSLSDLNISLGNLKLGGHPHIIFIDPDDTVYASLIFTDLDASGFVRIKSGSAKVRGVSLNLDNLGVFGRLRTDTLAFGLDSLRINQLRGKKQTFDFSLAAKASLFSGSFGRIRIPASLDGQVELDAQDKNTRIIVPRVSAQLAYIPLSLSGEVDLKQEGTYVDAALGVKGCALGKVLEEYAKNISPMLSDIVTDAVLNIDASANGLLAKGKLPQAKADISINPSMVRYLPKSLEGKLSLDLSATLNKNGVLDMDVRTLEVGIPGMDADVNGLVRDVLGGDPFIKADAAIACVVDSVMHMLPKDFPVDATGNLMADLAVGIHLSELNKYKFKDASVTGHLTGDRLVVRMPADSIYAALDNAGLDLSSGCDGLEVEFDMDTLKFRSGSSLSARVRNMRNRAVISKEEIAGRMIPFISFGTADSSLFVKINGNRVMARDVNLQAKASRRLRRNAVRPARQMRPAQDTSEFHFPDFMTEKDFRSKDIRFSLGEKVDTLLKLWNPSGSVSVGMGALMTPKFPLRTRIGAIDADFDGNTLNLKKASVVSGTSDFKANGKLTGLRGMLRGLGMLSLDLDASSSRINVNEISEAFRRGQAVSTSVAQALDDEDESFALDSIKDASLQEAGKLIVVPANLRANVNISASEVDYSNLEINDFSATVAMRDRCVKLADARIRSDKTKIYLDAFYSTRTKKDITAGVDVRMVDASAQKIINLIPAVDSILPLLRSFEGDLGCEVSATTSIDTNMNVIFPSLKGIIRISGENLNISDAGNLRKITKMLMFRNKNIGHIDNMYVDAVVRDNKLEVYPFILGVDRYELALGGLQNFDKNFDYHISIMRSPFIFKFGINLFGDFDKWKFSLCKPKYRNGVPVFTKQLDSLQLNIADGIRNVYYRGVDLAVEQGNKSLVSLDQQKRKVGYDYSAESEDLTAKEYMQIDAMMVEQEVQESDEAVIEEIDSFISQEIEQTAFDDRLSARLREMRK